MGKPHHRVRADDFAGVDTWVFDLDNTLYPFGSDLWPQIDQRITTFIAQNLNLDASSAFALQKFYYDKYGTSLRGLMLEHQVEAKAYLKFVHDINRENLPPNPPLGAAIAALPGRKLVLTNGSHFHAQETLKQLGIADHFEAIFDIEAAEFKPKPDPVIYERFFEKHGIVPSTAAMFEDLAKNLAVPHAHGMKTILVEPEGAPLNARTSVDYVTSDLVAFLHDILRIRLSDA
ncbi:MAG: pyrimidine 5'-nucleotidase [Hyphomicrobiales bacterium]|nr:pyrimidine 5'-nucleotidase [Hyphomicrobiales bacterium]MDE2114964.1 pyrimidine 5'-nucleotidase [Hyphomicrobiales bacterium]